MRKSANQPFLPISPRQCYQDARSSIRQILGLATASLQNISYDSNIEESIVTNTNFNSRSASQGKDNVKIESVVINDVHDVFEAHRHLKVINMSNFKKMIELNETNKNGITEESVNSNLFEQNFGVQINKGNPQPQCYDQTSSRMNQSSYYDQCQSLLSRFSPNCQRINQEQASERGNPINSSLGEIQERNQINLNRSEETIKSVGDLFQGSCFVKTERQEVDHHFNHSSLSFQIQTIQKYDKTIRINDTADNPQMRNHEKDLKAFEKKLPTKNRYQLYKEQRQQRRKQSEEFQIKPIYRDVDGGKNKKAKMSKNQILKGRYYQGEFSKHIEVTDCRIRNNLEYYEWKLGTVYEWRTLEEAQQRNFERFIEEARICGLQLVKYLPKNPLKNKGRPSRSEENMQFIKDIFNRVQVDKLQKFQKQKPSLTKHDNPLKRLKFQKYLQQSDPLLLSQKSEKEFEDAQFLPEATQQKNKREIKNDDGDKYYFNVFEYCDMEFIEKLHNIQRKGKNSIQVNNFFIVKNRAQLDERISRINQQSYEEISGSTVSSKIQQIPPLDRSVRLRTRNPLARSYLYKRMDCLYD